MVQGGHGAEQRRYTMARWCLDRGMVVQRSAVSEVPRYHVIAVNRCHCIALQRCQGVPRTSCRGGGWCRCKVAPLHRGSVLPPRRCLGTALQRGDGESVLPWTFTRGHPPFPLFRKGKGTEGDGGKLPRRGRWRGINNCAAKRPPLKIIIAGLVPPLVRCGTGLRKSQPCLLQRTVRDPA